MPPSVPGSSADAAPPQRVRSPAATKRPPPCSTNCFNNAAVESGRPATSLRTTTDRCSRLADVTRETGTASALKLGARPCSSAVVRKRFESAGASFPSTTRTDTGRLGDSTKKKVLSAGS